MRSLLFVPGDSERKLAKGLTSGADALIVDLEDSVAPANKAAARKTAADFLRDQRTSCPAKRYVRVNDLSTGMTDDDLAAVVAAAPDGIMLPKSNGGADVQHLAVKLRVHEAEAGLPDGVIRIIALVTETPGGVFAAGTYAGMSERLAGLTWGAEDLSAAIGAHSARDAAGQYTDVFRLARAVTLLGAAHADVAATDTVYPDFRDLAGFEVECRAALRDGFTGKMAIHPDQVSVINAVFTPSPEQVAKSRAIVEAFAAAGNPGVVAVEGKMYDRPHLKLAQRLLERAKAVG